MIPALVDLLATYYQAGNLNQMEAIARSMLATMPDDIVGLQFLGLALYQTGRIDDAYQAFKRVAAKFNDKTPRHPTTCEAADAVSYREAVRAHSGLADGWQRIAEVLSTLGFQRPAHRAYEAARASRGHGIPESRPLRGEMSAAS